MLAEGKTLSEQGEGQRHREKQARNHNKENNTLFVCLFFRVRDCSWVPGRGSGRGKNVLILQLCVLFFQWSVFVSFTLLKIGMEH